ncbi:hypothetical protein RB653_000415 [Dictyostelium firmibasis]|uniref:Uncharacterized protein n=1 Tax=Dictyostelium firmibasis TaxID=79012 RepID=A0AAN7UFB3_9MYCE
MKQPNIVPIFNALVPRCFVKRLLGNLLAANIIKTIHEPNVAPTPAPIKKPILILSIH